MTLRLRQIAVAVSAASDVDAEAALRRAAGRADLAELRLDLFHNAYDLPWLIQGRALPLIITSRPVREGGRSAQSDDTRRAVLRHAAELGAEYVDVEWDAVTPDLVDAIHAAGARCIVSRHCFDGMPPDLRTWPERLANVGADVVKVVGTARDVRDLVPVMDVLRDATQPTIAIAMGAAGQASRILCLNFDSCFLTFAAPTGREGTAPGQLSLDELLDVYRAKQLDSATAVYAILGQTVDDTLVRRLNRRLAADGQDAVVIPIATPAPVGETLVALESLPIAGWLLADGAAPESLAASVDAIEEQAAAAGHVNVVVRRGDGMVGYWSTSPEAALELLVHRGLG
jgi:3-dehydroquinate dehydratase / shikimate dehydrogenase